MTPTKIISGGQTGADQGGLDAAIALGIPHGGCCPKGRKSEAGRIPERYNLTEHASAEYPPRTRQNIIDSDGAVIFVRGVLEGGSLLTATLATRLGKPQWVINFASRPDDGWFPKTLREWCAYHRIATLNIAGSRESKAPGIQAAVARIVRMAFGGTP